MKVRQLQTECESAKALEASGNVAAALVAWKELHRIAAKAGLKRWLSVAAEGIARLDAEANVVTIQRARKAAIDRVNRIVTVSGTFNEDELLLILVLRDGIEVLSSCGAHADASSEPELVDLDEKCVVALAENRQAAHSAWRLMSRRCPTDAVQRLICKASIDY